MKIQAPQLITVSLGNSLCRVFIKQGLLKLLGGKNETILVRSPMQYLPIVTVLSIVASHSVVVMTHLAGRL